MNRVHVVHDESGRILAVADAAETTGPDGVSLRHQPRPRPGQVLVQMDLDEELQILNALALVRDYEVDVDTSSGTLKRRIT